MEFINRKFVWLLLSLIAFSTVTMKFFSTSCSLRSSTEVVGKNDVLKEPTIVSKPNFREESELERNRNLWRESKIANYKMIVKMSVTGLYNPASPVEIIVENGEATSIKTFEKDRRDVDVESYKRFGNNSIESMFEKIESAEQQKADKLEVKYDAKFGYPKEINIDQSFAVVDDESYVKVAKFGVIN